jgi:hypothetical protein
MCFLFSGRGILHFRQTLLQFHASHDPTSPQVGCSLLPLPLLPPLPEKQFSYE